MDVGVLKRLEAFVAVAECLSFSEASKRLYLSQPFLSRQVKELEGIFGVPLFQRKGRSLALTEAGLCLLEGANQTREQVQDMETRMRMVAAGHTQVLKLGASSQLWDYVLPPYLASFKLKHPAMTVSFITRTETQLFQLLLDNRVHLGFVAKVPPHRGLEAIPFIQDQFVVVAQPGHPLADGRKHPPRVLNGLPFVLPAGRVGGMYTSTWYLRSLGVEPATAVEVESAEAMKLAVRAGLGIAVHSRHIASEELAGGALAEIKIDTPAYSRTM